MYQIPELLKFPKLLHFFSQKVDGNMDFRFGKTSEVLVNRKTFLSKMGISLEDCVFLWVQHGNEISIVGEKNKKQGVYSLSDSIKQDALITDKKKLYLVLLVADCTPVILYDPIHTVIGLIHAGWKGADLNIVGKTIRKMRDCYTGDSKNLIAGIGPAARGDSFIKENPCQKTDPRWKNFIEPLAKNLYKVDFVGLCKKQLVDTGVGIENIFDCGIDTVKDERFFSHVREGKLSQSVQGRSACVVGLK